MSASWACSGTLPWSVAGRTRTTLFYKFNVSGSSYSGEYFDPADFAQCTPQAAQSTLSSADLLWLCRPGHGRQEAPAARAAKRALQRQLRGARAALKVVAKEW